MRAAAACCAIALLAGCGSSGSKQPPSHPSGTAFALTLNLKGGDTAQSTRACGALHHFTRYTGGSRIEFAGTVRPVPTGRWKVKLKIKRCRGGSARVVAKVQAARDKHAGAFSGRLPKLAPGAYFARASLYVDGRKRARSDKRHFTLR